MKCRVCGTEIGEQIYCFMCGATVNPQQETEVEQQEKMETEHSYQYPGIDADATTVLSTNYIVNEKEEKENNEKEKCVVSEEVEMPRKSHKKLVLVLGIIAAVILMAGIGIFCYLHYIYPNRITYMQKSLYFESEENIRNSEGLKLDVSFEGAARILINADYSKNIFLYAGTDGKSLERIAEEGNRKAIEDKKIVSVIADDAISKVYYWTQEEENIFSLHCLEEEDTLKRYVKGVNGTVISQNGNYLAYSYRVEEDAYVVCEVMPSGEVNQIATLETPVRVLAVTEDGKVFCEQQNSSNGRSEGGEEPEVSYSIYCIQDRKNYGIDLSEIIYFGYYSSLEAFVVQTADKSVYYVDTKEDTQRLIATNVDWFSDISEPCRYQQVCDRKVILGEIQPKTLENSTPCYYYLKENSLYSYDILKDNESQKVAGNFGRAQNIEMWNQGLIFYLAGEQLYSCEKTGEEWQKPKLLAKECTGYQYSPEQECIYYLAGEMLYSYKDGKEEKISDKVKSFDLNQEEGVLVYSTDTSLIVCKKDEEEYAVKTEGAIFAVGQDVYYTDAKNTLHCLSGESGEIEEVADKIEAIQYIWK